MNASQVSCNLVTEITLADGTTGGYPFMNKEFVNLTNDSIKDKE